MCTLPSGVGRQLHGGVAFLFHTLSLLVPDLKTNLSTLFVYIQYAAFVHGLSIRLVFFSGAKNAGGLNVVTIFPRKYEKTRHVEDLFYLFIHILQTAYTHILE